MTYVNKVALVLANSPEFERSKSLEVLGSINTVLNSLPDFEEIFIVTSKHISNLYAANDFEFTREAKLVAVPRTKGALATLCIGIDSVSKSKELFVIPINSLIKTPALETFIEEVSNGGAHVSVLTINSTDPIYSYARITQSGKLIEVIEKQVVGNVALSGIFYFKSAIEVHQCAAWAFKHNLNTNGLFYIAPSLNYFIAVGKSILVSRLKSEDFNRV
jgi:bifunctional N-acetylglucosamine-1-phosphate-uridyltransferase/glucosamine-1-phosphate-acetyltransferase GlmU-like protein